MKIAVMTRWGTKNNYGQVLQCYALQEYLKNAGHDPYVVKFNYLKADTPRNIIDRLFYIINIKERLIPNIRNRINKFLFDREKNNDYRQFDDFRGKYIKQSEKIYNTYSELVEAPPDADVYITGSDQVFAVERVETKRAINRIRAFYLDFGSSEVERIAYSASFGANSVDEIYKKNILPLLKNFKYISIREKEGVEICRKAGFDYAECVPDPTLLLSEENYLKLFEKENIKNVQKGRYCFLYLLNRKDNFDMKVMRKWAAKRNLEIIYVASSGKYDRYKKCYPTIAEWLCLIKHAEYVITNSYHCAIFSIIFKKRFAIIPQIGGYIGQNTRLDTLFELLDIEPRYISDNFDVVDEPVEWNKITNILDNIQNKNNLLKNINKEKRE